MRYWDQCWWSSCGSRFAHVRIVRYAPCASLDHTISYGASEGYPPTPLPAGYGRRKSRSSDMLSKTSASGLLIACFVGYHERAPKLFRRRGRAGVAGAYNQSSRRAGHAHSTGVERIKSRLISPLYSGGFCASLRLAGHRRPGGRGCGRNCELHLAQVRGAYREIVGVSLPTFIPETG
jgi:hypothetical protein